jgi:uracil-DNA glycosylase family 4
MMMDGMVEQWDILERQIVGCHRCPRLRAYCSEVARRKVRRYQAEEYWGKPVPGFGDRAAWLWVVGLAPGAHGANRTGRMFTGDDSGRFLFASLCRVGLANQPDSTRREDGLRLRGVFISAAARCAPPDNRPRPEELRNCAPFLEAEFRLLIHLRVIVALGKIAYDAVLRMLRSKGGKVETAPFRHLGAMMIKVPEDPPTGRAGERHLTLISSYHPSRQNTQTGRLTPAMLDCVWHLAMKFAPKRGENRTHSFL